MAELNLDDLERKVLRLGDLAVTIVKETLDKYAKQFIEEIERTIPRRSGGLAARLKAVEISGRADIYGWSISFTGKAKNGMSYHDIAFILNYYGYGRWDTSDLSTIREIGFISQAVTALKGINTEINERWRNAVI